MTAADTTQNTTAVLDTDMVGPDVVQPAQDAAAPTAAPSVEHPAYAATAQQPAPTQYATPQPRPEGSTSNSFAITSFVLGIASIVSSWTFIAPIIGLIFGILALRRGTKERTLALWGVWLNGVMLALTALIVLGFVALAGFGILSGLASGSWYY